MFLFELLFDKLSRTKKKQHNGLLSTETFLVRHLSFIFSAESLDTETMPDLKQP